METAVKKLQRGIHAGRGFCGHFCTFTSMPLFLSLPSFPYNPSMPQAAAQPQSPYLSLNGINSKLPVTYFVLKPRDPFYSASRLESWLHLTRSSPLASLSCSFFFSCYFLHGLIYARKKVYKMMPCTNRHWHLVNWWWWGTNKAVVYWVGGGVRRRFHE